MAEFVESDTENALRLLSECAIDRYIYLNTYSTHPCHKIFVEDICAQHKMKTLRENKKHSDIWAMILMRQS